MSDIFLAYSRRDLERIQPLVQALESHGWTVWWDMTLLPGDQFTTVIDQELAAARCVVVIWSTASVHSRWVRAEATEGADRDILIPVLIDEVRPPLEFRQFQTARFLEWHDAEPPPEFANVRERIIHLLEVSPLPAPSTPLDRLQEEERILLRHNNPLIRQAMIYTLGAWLQSDDGDKVVLARDVLQAHRREEEDIGPRNAIDEVFDRAEQATRAVQRVQHENTKWKFFTIVSGGFLAIFFLVYLPLVLVIIPNLKDEHNTFIQSLALYLGVVGLGFLLLGVGLLTLSLTSGLPLGLLVRQGGAQWVPVGTGYRRYHSQWAALTPLEGLLLLLVPTSRATTPEQFLSLLTKQQTPVTPDRLESALENLVRQYLLSYWGDSYRLTEPGLARALQMHEAEAGLGRLSGRVRAEHPLFAGAHHFFSAAGFALSDVSNDPLAFLCRPTSSTLEQQFKAPVYARLVPDQPLDQEAVRTLQQAAKAIAERANVLFAIVNQTPSDGGWIAIGALRADEGVQIIPIDDAMIQHGRERQKERETLQAHLRRFLGGQRDLYNVRDPVADRLNFFGREVRAAELLEILVEGRPVALFGLRKMGKSSLLQYLRDQAPFPVAYVDLQAGTELPLLYGNILTSWQNSLRVKVAGFTWEPQALSGSDPSATFATVARDLMASLKHDGHEPRLGLFVDEVELIVPPGTSLSSDPEAEALAHYLAFARTLRGLAQETGDLSLLVVGVDPQLNRVSRWGGQQNPFYQFFREEYLGPLNRDDCIQMVRNIGRQMGLVYDDETVDFIAEVSGRHPFLARQLCSTAYRITSQEVAGKITLAQLQEAAGRFVREPNTAALLDERGLWGEVTNPKLWPQSQIRENETLLTSLAEVQQQSETALLTAARERQAREQSLFELEQRSVLSRFEELLDIQFGLFRNWIRRYKHE